MAAPALNDWEYYYDPLRFGGDQPFGLTLVEGLHPPESRTDIVNRSEGHGSFIHAGFLLHRTLMFTGDMAGDSVSFMNRLNTWREAFAPRRTEKELHFKKPHEVQKIIKCVPVRRFYPENPRFSINYVTWNVQLLASDPRIYSADEHSQQINPTEPVGGIDPSFTFDVSPGGSAQTGIATVTNGGVFGAPHKARIDGPTLNPKIINLTTEEWTEFVIELVDGEYLEIDYLDKIVTLNGQTSRYNTLPGYNKWWVLEPGGQDIQFISDTVGGNTKLTLTWRDCWL